MSDPWSSLQAAGVPSDDGLPGKVHPAYANYSDRGEPQVGFDVFMELPGLCLKCAAPTSVKRVAEILVKRDTLSQLVQRGDMSRRNDKVGAGKCKLDLPHCEDCLSAYTRARKAFNFSFLYPVIALALIVAGGKLLGQSAALILFFLALVAVPVMHGRIRSRFKKHSIDIAALDTDGFIVLTRVDPQAGEAIVAASLA